MTDAEKHAILDQIETLVADLREDGPDAADGVTPDSRSE